MCAWGTRMQNSGRYGWHVCRICYQCQAETQFNLYLYDCYLAWMTLNRQDETTNSVHNWNPWEKHLKRRTLPSRCSNGDEFPVADEMRNLFCYYGLIMMTSRTRYLRKKLKQTKLNRKHKNKKEGKLKKMGFSYCLLGRYWQCFYNFSNIAK